VHAIVGLGNPGREYSKTRHNIGFMILDKIAEDKQCTFKPGKGPYYYSETSHTGFPLILIKPTTYMNRSGIAVRNALKFFEFNYNNLLILYDDFHLDFGVLRFRAKGSDGGHNGLKSIIYELERQDFHRLRFGIGDPSSDTVDHVLSEFSKTEEKELDFLINKSIEGIGIYLKFGIDVAMNRFNRNFLN